MLYKKTSHSLSKLENFLLASMLVEKSKTEIDLSLNFDYEKSVRKNAFLIQLDKFYSLEKNEISQAEILANILLAKKFQLKQEIKYLHKLYDAKEIDMSY